MTSWNQIQSIVCNTVRNTSESLLVCAPREAGKTNAAMLCIQQAVQPHLEGGGAGQGRIKKDQFKIVYFAPTKALAAEMAA